MSYTVETYLGVAILIPVEHDTEDFENIEGIEYFSRREDDSGFWYFIPCVEEEGFISRWTDKDDNVSVVLDNLSPKGEIAKFKRENKEVLSEVKKIAPDFEIRFVFLTGGS